MSYNNLIKEDVTPNLFVSMVEAMDEWVDTLKWANSDTAMEAEGNNTPMKEKIKAFVDKGIQTAKRFFQNLFERLGYMIEALGHRIHKKDVHVPQELAASYQKLKSGAEDITKERFLFNFYQKFKDLHQGSYGYSYGVMIANVKDEIHQYMEKVKKISYEDVLKGRSASEYMDSIQDEKRNAVINPAKEQKEISTMHRAWKNLEKIIMRNLDTMRGGIKIDAKYGGAPDAKEAEKALMGATNAALNATMQFISGMVNILMYLQKYISIFIQIDKMPEIKNKNNIIYQTVDDNTPPSQRKAIPQHT